MMFSCKFRFADTKFVFLRGAAKVFFAVVCGVIFSAAALGENSDAPTKKINKQAEKAMRRGEFETASNLWQQVLDAEPESSEHRLKLSYALYKQRKLIQSYDQAMLVFKNDQANVRVRSLIGAVYLAAGHLDQAKAFLQDALIRSPDEPLALATSALLDFYENRSKVGIAKLRRAVFLEPEEPDFIFALAQIAARTENYREAADSYERFLRIAPISDVDRRERIQGLIDFLRYLGSIKSLYEIGGKPQTVIACEIINNRPIINVRVNGSEPLRFVLDTGSGMTVISEDAAAKLGVKSIARGGKARAIGGGGKFDIVYGFLDSLSIGEVKVERVPVYIRKFNAVGDKFDGYLGLSAISKFITTLDYSQKLFGLTVNVADKNKGKKAKNYFPASLPIIENENAAVPLRITSSGFLSSQVKIAGLETPLNFIVDTGASVSVVSAEAAKQYHISQFAHTTLLRVYGAAGVAENVATLILPRLTLGETSRDKIMAAVLDLAPVNETTGYEQAGILGGNFLLHYRLTFNFQNSTVKFEPSQAAAVPKVTKISVGGETPN